MFHVEHDNLILQKIEQGAKAIGVQLSDHVIAQFSLYLLELKTWNQRVNLTTVTQDDEIISKHFVDSLAATSLIPAQAQGLMLDIGSGAGFPGLPLGIVNEHLAVTLLEPSQKKVAFLRSLIGTFELQNVRAIAKRIEEYSGTARDIVPFSWVVTRALRIEPWLECIDKLLINNGNIILWRTSHQGDLTKVLPQPWRVEDRLDYVLPFGYGERSLIVLGRS